MYVIYDFFLYIHVYELCTSMIHPCPWFIGTCILPLCICLNLSLSLSVFVSVSVSVFVSVSLFSRTLSLSLFLHLSLFVSLSSVLRPAVLHAEGGCNYLRDSYERDQ
jgi:hypothetical protein